MPRTQKILWFCVLAMVGQNATGFAFDKRSFESNGTRPSLLELYSSEGCSSCPPAEDWLSDWVNSKDLWKDVVPVCFHVDYWDYLGWKDRWASPKYTARQRWYARNLGMNSIYTPGFFLNGQEWRSWFRSGPSIPSAKKTNNQLKIELLKPLQARVLFQPSTSENHPWVVNAVVLGMGIVSKVQAGENRGRTLTHDFTVLSHTSAKLAPNKAYSAVLHFPSPATKAPAYAIAVWITNDHSLEPAQVLGGFIPGEFIAAQD